MAETALFLISAGLTSSAAIAGGVGAYQQGRYLQRVSEENARMTREAARINEQRLRTQRAKGLDELRASIGASGLSVLGSPLELLGDEAAQAEMDALTVRHGGQVQARQQRIEGELAAAQGRAGLIGGLLSAPAPFLEPNTFGALRGTSQSLLG